MEADVCSVSPWEFDDLEDCEVSIRNETLWETLTEWRVQAGYGPDKPGHPTRLSKPEPHSDLDISQSCRLAHDVKRHRRGREAIGMPRRMERSVENVGYRRDLMAIEEGLQALFGLAA